MKHITRDIDPVDAQDLLTLYDTQLRTKTESGTDAARLFVAMAGVAVLFGA